MKWHSFDSFSHLWLDPLLFPFILYHQAWTLQLWGVCKRSIFIGGNGQQQQIDLNFQLHVSLKLWICFVAWSAAPPQLWSSSIGKLTWVTWPLSQSRTWLWDTKRSSLFSDSGFSWQWQATELLQSFYRVTQQVLDISLKWPQWPLMSSKTSNNLKISRITSNNLNGHCWPQKELIASKMRQMD